MLEIRIDERVPQVRSKEFPIPLLNLEPAISKNKKSHYLLRVPTKKQKNENKFSCTSNFSRREPLAQFSQKKKKNGTKFISKLF